jgi:hypothetical protein
MRKIVLTLVALATILPAQAAADEEDLKREEVQQLIQRFDAVNSILQSHNSILQSHLAGHAREIAALKAMLLLQTQIPPPNSAPVAAPAPMCEIP